MPGSGMSSLPNSLASLRTVRKILLTGMSGTGKSAALAELEQRGFTVVDTDHGGWSEWSDADGGYLWREDRIAELLARENGPTLYVSGTVSNQGRFYPRFDAVVLLSAPAEVLLRRIATRATNDYGKSSEDRDLILRHLVEVEPLLRATCTHEVDAAQPIELVVQELVAIGEGERRAPTTIEGVVIRPERHADHAVIAEVVRAAFVEHPDEVASFVERVRASEEFIPELALVAEDSSGVIAHVMLSWVGVEGGSRTRILNLTPMSVRPDRQRIGVGTRLIRDALGRAEEAGEPAVMVEGVAAYYPRFGFERASGLGFISPHPKIPDAAFMVKRLPGYSPDLAGRIVYPAAFHALGY